MAKKTPWENGPLTVAENGRGLQNGGKPFFWLGDTAWLLFSSLDENDAYRYLKNRADKGFSVIQADFIHRGGECDSEGYWRHAKRIVSMAEELGLYMALLPAWGDMVRRGLLNTTNAGAYAEFLAKQYAGCPNVLWLIGGDVRGDEGLEVFHLLARSLKTRCPGQLMGFHPFGRTSSSQWFHDAEWLDFNMFQSGHRRYDQTDLAAWDDRAGQDPQYGEDCWRYVRQDLALSPQKPTADGEPSYEQIAQGLHDDTQPCWQACDVRRYAYWSLFAGAMGHTYGDNAVMQFYREGLGKGAFGVHQYWFDAMHNPGSAQMTHLKRLMEDFDYQLGAPAQELLAESCRANERYDRISVFAGKGFILCYSYSGKPFSLALSSLAWKTAYAWWFDPVTGVYSYSGRCPCGESMAFCPPKRPEGQNDWVLVLTPRPGLPK